MATTKTKKSAAKTSAAKTKRASKPAEAPKPSYGSRARRKASLVNELQAGVDPGRAAEIRSELDGPLGDVPVLTREELGRLED